MPKHRFRRRVAANAAHIGAQATSIMAICEFLNKFEQFYERNFHNAFPLAVAYGTCVRPFTKTFPSANCRSDES